jgi:hypothetical protein
MKVSKWLEFHQKDKLYLKLSISNVLTAFSLMRPDIGFVSGMEKIACLIGLVMHQSYVNDQDYQDMNEEIFE